MRLQETRKNFSNFSICLWSKEWHINTWQTPT